jgi:hypothetical protein
VCLPAAIPETTRFVKIRMLQTDGDWDAYVGYLSLGSDGGHPVFEDGFTTVTATDRYVRQSGVTWRTDTEGGLICPERRNEWAEIVFPTRGGAFRWICQAVHTDDIVEVWASPDDREYVKVAQVSGAGGLAGRWQDADAQPLTGLAFRPLRGTVTEARFEDGCGAGRSLRVTGQLEGTPLGAALTLREYADQALCTLEFEVANPTGADAHVGDLVFGRATGEKGGAIDLGAPAARCSVVGSDYWFDEQPMARLDRAGSAEPWWFTALADRETRHGLAMGVDEAANVGTRFVFRRDGDRTGWEALGETSPSNGRSLRLPAGATFRANRLSFAYRENVLDALDAYAVHVRDMNEIHLNPAYAGLFTGYSSDPELKTVIRLDRKRVDDLLAIVRDKLQPFGLDTIKIEFEPCGSPNVLDAAAYRIEDYFPGGARVLTDHLRSEGFRPAFQSRTFLYVKAGEPDEAEKVRAMYRRFTREWGFRYLMLDFNYTDLVNLDDTRPATQCYRDRFRMVREAVGPDVFIEACMIAPGPVIGSADGFRPSHDYRGGNENSVLPGFANRAFLHGRVFQLDTEFYDAALWPFVWDQPPYASSIANVQSWVGLCGVLGYSFLAGGCIERTSEERFHILTRALPPTGRAARPLDLVDDPLPTKYALEMTEGPRHWWVVGLFNWSHEETREVTVDLAEAGLDPSRAFAGFDFYDQRYLGEVSGSVTRRLAPRSCAILHLTPMDGQPVVVGSDRHVTGAYACTGVQLDAAHAALTGTITSVGDGSTTIYVLLPEGLRPRSWEGCEAELAAPRVLRVTARPTDPAGAEFAVRFAE